MYVKKSRYKGYLLLESMVSLVLFGSVILMLSQQFIFFQQQLKAEKQKLEAARFAYEISQDSTYQNSESKSYQKVSNQMTYNGKRNTNSIKVWYVGGQIEIKK